MQAGPPLHERSILTCFTVLYILVLFIGLAGNVMTIAVVRRTRDLQSNTNFFLSNLAVSDLILLISGIPFDMVYMWRTYPAIAGSWHCIVKGQLSETASNVSILTILILTLERWVAICRPLHVSVYFNRDRIFKYISTIWMIGGVSALVLSVQFAVIPYRSLNSSIVYENVTQCDLEPNRTIPYMFEATSAVFFVLPMSFIVSAYGLIIRELNRSKESSNIRQPALAPMENGPESKARFLIIIMLITVASVFFICFLPLHIQRLMTTYDKDRISSSQANAHFSRIWFTVSGLLHYVSSASNPIIYNAMSRRFRLACRSMILGYTRWFKRKIRCCRKSAIYDDDIIDGILLELAPMGRTDTTSFKERVAMWLLGSSRSRKADISRFDSYDVQEVAV